MALPDRRKNRRVDSSHIFINCRLCWRRIKLEPDRIELTNNATAYRCQMCESSFLIRYEDAVALGVAQPERRSIPEL